MVPLNTPGFYNLRLRFRKVGSLQFVSHLDLVRTFSKIVVRSKLPLWYTEGFNPKPKLVFSAPLSVGIQSETEFLDVRLSRYVDPADALTAMNENVTDEMRFFDAYYAETKLSEIAFLSYEIRVLTDGVGDALAKQCEEVLLAGTVEAEKKSKDGEAKRVDIRPLIRELKAEAKDGFLVLYATLSADSSTFLNPDLLIRVLKEKGLILGKDDPLTESLSVVRLQAFDKEMRPFR